MFIFHHRAAKIATKLKKAKTAQKKAGIDVV
jgi:hypothetical protein